MVSAQNPKITNVARFNAKLLSQLRTECLYVAFQKVVAKSLVAAQKRVTNPIQYWVRSIWNCKHCHGLYKYIYTQAYSNKIEWKYFSYLDNTIVCSYRKVHMHVFICKCVWLSQESKHKKFGCVFYFIFSKLTTTAHTHVESHIIYFNKKNQVFFGLIFSSSPK